MGKRLGARLFDVVLFGWLYAFVLVEVQGRLFGGDLLARQPNPLANVGRGQSLLAFIVLWLILETVPTMWRGATVGKFLFGVRVSDLDGKTPGAASALIRTIGLYGGWLIPVVGPIVALIAAASALVLPQQRGLHDRLAGTVVMDDPLRTGGRRAETDDG